MKTKSTPASLSLKGQVTKHKTVKWSIQQQLNVNTRILKTRDNHAYKPTELK